MPMPSIVSPIADSDLQDKHVFVLLVMCLHPHFDTADGIKAGSAIMPGQDEKEEEWEKGYRWDERVQIGLDEEHLSLLPQILEAHRNRPCPLCGDQMVSREPIEVTR